MAKRRKAVDVPIDLPAPEPEPKEEPVLTATAESTGTRVRKPRIILRFLDSGLPDLAALEPPDRQALEQAFRGQQGAADASVDPALVTMVVRGLGSLEAVLLAQRFDLAVEECRETIGPAEPLGSMIGEAGSKVIVKYNLTGRYGEEIALLSLITVWQAGVFQQLRAMRQRKNATRSDLGQAAAGKIHPGAGAGSGE